MLCAPWFSRAELTAQRGALVRVLSREQRQARTAPWGTHLLAEKGGWLTQKADILPRGQGACSLLRHNKGNSEEPRSSFLRMRAAAGAAPPGRSSECHPRLQLRAMPWSFACTLKFENRVFKEHLRLRRGLGDRGQRPARGPALGLGKPPGLPPRSLAFLLASF